MNGMVIFSQVKENSRQNFACPNRYFTFNIRSMPLPTKTVKNNNRPNCSTVFGTFPRRCFAWLQRETSRNFLVFTFYGGNVVNVLVLHCR